MKIMIVVKGGVVQEIISTEEIEVYLIDHDNLEYAGKEKTMAAYDPAHAALICDEHDFNWMLKDQLDDYQARFNKIEEGGVDL